MYFKELIAPATRKITFLKQGYFIAWSGLVGTLTGAVCLAVPLTTQAQNYPNKPITFYVSYAAGATTDITARALARAAEPILGVPITIDNKGGGGGTVAAGMLVSKKPDGYTVLIGSTSAITTRPALMKVSYKTSDIVGVMQYSYFHNGSVVIPADSPWKSIEDFIEAAKKSPGMSFATAGGGGVATTSQQMGVEALKRCKGLDFKHVPTKGGTEANTMLMGKHVNFTSGSLGALDTQLVYEFFQGFVNHALCTLHIDNLKGVNAHHQCETIFKAFARAVRMALELDPRSAGVIPSTKGSL